MEQKIKYHEKVKVCTTAMWQAEKNIGTLLDDWKGSVTIAAAFKRIAEELRDERLRVQPTREFMSPEERARRRLLKMADSRIERLVTFYKRSGIRKGGHGLRRKDNAKVVFTCDPTLSWAGITIGVHYIDIDKHEVEDPAAFVLDTSIAPTPKGNPMAAVSRAMPLARKRGSAK